MIISLQNLSKDLQRNLNESPAKICAKHSVVRGFIYVCSRNSESCLFIYNLFQDDTIAPD